MQSYHHARAHCYSAVAVLCALLISQASVAGQTGARQAAAQSPIFRNTTRGVDYVGSRVCASCHADVYEKFTKTAMGRSMSPASDVAQMEKAPAPVTIHDEKFNRYFQVFRRDSGLYQSEYELGPDGREVFRNTQKVEYAIG